MFRDSWQKSHPLEPRTPVYHITWVPPPPPPGTGVALHELIRRFEAGVGDFWSSQPFVVGLLGGNSRSICSKRKVDAGIGHQVGLELRYVNVEGAIEAQRGSNRRNDLGYKTIEIGVGWSLDVQVPSADVVDGFVVVHECAVGVLQGRVRRQDRIVRLDHGGRHLRSGVDHELELGLLAVVDGETLHEQRSEAGRGAAAEAVKEEEALKTRALVGQLPGSVKDEVNDLLPTV